MPDEKAVKEWENRIPLRRTGEHRELANLAAYLLSDEAGYINGEAVTIDGGEWMAGAGQFNFAAGLTEKEWEKMKPAKKN